ncbi:hypothetical protein Tco_0727339 [Tanacetum coccineum]|uniref:Uncharacterized protein n=1 Tax=Tanacetum coccineum TaxID=301880 RepID=A0ABQ4YI51_9ASTR
MRSSESKEKKLLIVASQDSMLLANVTAIKEAKDLATLLLDELIGNLNVYEIILENDGVASKTTKENVKSLALKAKVTREQASDDSDSQGGSDKDIEEEAKAFNLMARNFQKFFRKECWDEMITGRKEGSSKNAYSRKGLLRIRVTLLSSSISRIMKSTGKVNFPTLTSMFSTIQKGYCKDRSTNLTLILVDLKVLKDNFAYKKYGIRLMLAPRSAKALQEKVLLKVHGIRKLSGSLSLGGTLF